MQPRPPLTTRSHRPTRFAVAARLAALGALATALAGALAAAPAAGALAARPAARPAAVSVAARAHPVARARPVARANPVARAKAINLRASDLPSSMHWTSSPVGKPTKAVAAAQVKAASCLRAAGAGTGDPFGASGRIGGGVLADVSSAQYSEKGSPGIPAANSEVVVVASAKAAAADLHAVTTAAGRRCIAAQFRVDSSAQGLSGPVTTAVRPQPRHGVNGGARVQMVESAQFGSTKLAVKLYNDEYFYVVGADEVTLSFLNIAGPFPQAGATAAVNKVLARAATAAG